MKIFNASGHPIIQEGIHVTGEVPVPNVDLTNSAAVYNLAKDIARAAAPDVRNGIPIALPGMSILAAHVLAYLHGLCGYWPSVAWGVKVGGVFVWSEENTSDLHEMRTQAREHR